jgi:hypothetical protein
MANLTPTEQAHLGIVRPELMALLLALMDQAGARLGFTLAVPDDGGTRSTARQQQLYNDALTAAGDTAYAVGKPGHSRHEYGAAFDVHIVAGGHDGGYGTDADYRALADLGEALGLHAGYYFAERGEGSHSDPYHFQLDEAFSTSQQRWAAMHAAGMTLTAALPRRSSSSRTVAASHKSRR